MMDAYEGPSRTLDAAFNAKVDVNYQRSNVMQSGIIMRNAIGLASVYVGANKHGAKAAKQLIRMDVKLDGRTNSSTEWQTKTAER